MEEKKKQTTKKKATTKKTPVKKTTGTTTAKKTTPKVKSQKKQPIKKEETVLFQDLGIEVDEIVTNNQLKEQNQELRSDIKKYKVLMILLILLVLVSVLSQGLKYYSEYLEEYQDTKVSVIHSEPMDLKSKEVLDLYNTVSMFKYVNAGNFMGYFYERAGATVDSIDDEVKVYMGLSLIDTKKYMKDSKLIIPEKKVKNNVEKIFGPGIKYQNKSLGSDNLCYLSLATFNNKKGIYEVDHYQQCKSSYESYYGTDLISANRYSNRIEITEKVYYGEYEKEGNKMVLHVYKQASLNDENNLIVTLDAQDLDEKTIIKDFSDMLNSYKYTFYLEKGKYYLHSIERVNE